MATEHGEETETLMEKIAEKFHGDDSSSSSSDNEKKSESSPLTFKSKVFRIFDWEKLIHLVLGGGKLGLPPLTLVCHWLILTLDVMFVYSNATTFINKVPPRIPEVSIHEDLDVRVTLGLRYEINRGVVFLRSIASGRDLKKFLGVIGDCRIMGAISCWELVQFLDLVLLSLESF